MATEFQLLLMIQQAEYLGPLVEDGTIERSLALDILARHAGRMELQITDYGLENMLTSWRTQRQDYLDAKERYASRPARRPRGLQRFALVRTLTHVGKGLLRKPDSGPKHRSQG